MRTTEEVVKEEQDSLDLYKAFAVDVDEEKEGRWFENFVPGLDLKIARQNNTIYQRFFGTELEAAQLKARDEGGELTPEITESIMNRAIAKAILVDWRGNGTAGLNYKGELLGYTYENALSIVGDPEMHEFRDRVWQRAGNFENFLKSRERADAKN